jgi:hypothetical protein
MKDAQIIILQLQVQERQNELHFQQKRNQKKIIKLQTIAIMSSPFSCFQDVENQSILHSSHGITMTQTSNKNSQ